jgi:hypothetical protein
MTNHTRCSLASGASAGGCEKGRLERHDEVISKFIEGLLRRNVRSSQ